MVVIVTNLTDAPGKKPTQIDIYNRTLDPGSNIKLPADLVNKKIRSLETNGLIAIGSLPPWYLAAKKRKGRPLTDEEKLKMQETPAPSPPVSLAAVKEKKKDEKKPAFSVIEEPQEQLKSTKG